MEKIINNNLLRDSLSQLTESLLKVLLKDRTTKKNLIWATEDYASYGEDCSARQEIVLSRINMLYSTIIQPRILKPEELKIQRTRKRAEVFTPSWVCNMQNNVVDDDWFGRKNVFNKTSNTSWKTISSPIVFPEEPHKTWKDYVDSRRLEITCGEAPYLTSRYDMVTGENIDLKERIGIFDRKLRVVNENAENETDWFQWAKRACQSTYGYEYQGDSVLIARLNLLLTFEENLEFRWQRKAVPRELEEIARIISWNIWQMDGLHDTVPAIMPEQNYGQLSLFGTTENTRMCRIMNWRAQRSVEFSELKTMNLPFSDKTDSKGRKANMKFDVIIGNPPYQEEQEGDNKQFAPPIYNKFLDESYKIADVVEMIHPARFLFNAGSTPNIWNQKMLNDKHLKVIFYEQDSSKVFSNTDIKGGVAVTYHDTNKNFGAIKTFTAFEELNSIIHKAGPGSESESLMSIIYVQNRFNLEALYTDYPEYRSIIGSNGQDKRFRNNIFEKIPLFTDQPVNDDDIAVIGVIENKRQWRYFPRKYFDLDHENIFCWKILIPESNGSGAIGDVFSTPIIEEPTKGYTQTFIGIGAFKAKQEAENALRYIKSKFCRTLLGTLKITQHNNKNTWANVPLQDFTPQSDIDWTKSIHEIDLQLYKKYGLDEKEIEFIESHVKEMA